MAEDLGKPREQMLADLLAGKTKFHNVFHYPTASWGDVGIIAWLVDAAAIVSQQALRDSSYAPYARTMKKICWEESVHIMHGRDVVLTMMNGTDAQRAMVQDALEPMVGPAHADARPADRPGHGSRPDLEDQGQGQRAAAPGVPVASTCRASWELGLTIPDPELRVRRGEGRWHYTEPDWDELRSVVTGHGPMSQERLQFRRDARDATQWVRDAILGPAETAVA